MSGWQEIIAVLIVLGAAAYAAVAIYRRSLSFASKSQGCGTNCGCSGSPGRSAAE